MIKIKDLSFRYGKKNILDKLHCYMELGKLYFLLGENGVGKSTFLKCLLGIVKISNGEIYINGRNTKEMSISERASILSYVPQEHYPSFNQKVIDVLLMGIVNQLQFYEIPGIKEKKKARKILEKLSILHLEDRGYSEISGGERQLVLIGRALMQDSKIILMDEPHSSLDYGNKIYLMKILSQLAKQGYTIILSSHNPQDVFSYGDEVLVLQNGKIVAQGKPKEILTSTLLTRLYKTGIDVMEIKELKQIICLPKKEE